MMRNILVTGGAGYVGAHTCKALAAAGYVPIAYDNLSNGRRDLVRWGPLVVGDLAERERLQETLLAYQVAGIVHMAARIEVGESMRDPLSVYRTNVAGAINLVEAAVLLRCRCIVFSSTAAVYGLPETVPIPEDHRLRPVNPYGESKLAVERLLSWAERAHALAYATLRYFNASGGDPEGQAGECHDPETHLIPLALEAGLGLRPPLKVFGTDYETPDGTAVRDYIHVTDLARAHVLSLDRLLQGAGSFVANLGTGHGYSVRQILTAAAGLLERPVPHELADRRAGDPPVLVADPTRAKRLLGWEPKLSGLDSILSTALAWHRARASQAADPP